MNVNNARILMLLLTVITWNPRTLLQKKLMLLLKTKLHSKESTEENVTEVGKTSMEAECVVENKGTKKKY